MKSPLEETESQIIVPFHWLNYGGAVTGQGGIFIPPGKVVK